MNPVIAVYREFAPHAALQPYIRAVFSFIPGAEDGLYRGREPVSSWPSEGMPPALRFWRTVTPPCHSPSARCAMRMVGGARLPLDPPVTSSVQ